MVDQERWQRAQRYEASYWNRASNLVRNETKDLAWYGWRADRLGERLRALGLDHLTEGYSDVLEVGSGPVGLVSFFPAGRAVAVDPLAERFSRMSALTQFRSDSVFYHRAVGEQLPFRDGVFDLLVIENCIDHVRDVQQVMTEIARVLTAGGVLYLTVNCRSRWGYYLHRVLAGLRLDPGHPHTFTVDGIRRLVSRFNFQLLDFDSGSLREARRADLRSGTAKGILKSLLGVSHTTATVVARLEANSR